MGQGGLMSGFFRDVGKNQASMDADPGLLKQNSSIQSFTTSRYTYPGVRIFFKKHVQADQLPTDPGPLPLLVFIHGLGGSIAQFHPLLTSLTNIAPCLAIDLPGCGLSEFAPTAWDAYSTAALLELLETIIPKYCDSEAGQKIVVIGHSMGAALSAGLASRSGAHTGSLVDQIVGVIAICPPAGPPTQEQVTLYRKLLWIPTPIFDLWRGWDRRGGTESASVKRFVGVNADAESKRLQHRFNNQSRTPVWRRMAWGTLPTYEGGEPIGGLPGAKAWSFLDVPVLVIGGADDNVTPPKEVDKILGYLNSRESGEVEAKSTEPQPIAVAAAALSMTVGEPAEPPSEQASEALAVIIPQINSTSHDTHTQGDPLTPTDQPTTGGIPSQPAHPTQVIKSIILPSPATHALLYTPVTARILACYISEFLSSYITGRLSLAWQLQYLSREGKWDVKNLAKWQNVNPVSDPIPLPALHPTIQDKNSNIITPIFRAMKTMREVDDVHSPAHFVARWGKIIKDVVDISHDNPVYDPAGLEKAGVRYHKFPTVSKIPPTDAEVGRFIELIDRLRAEQPARARGQGWDKRSCDLKDESENSKIQQQGTEEGEGAEEGEETVVIGVHCHYGFNRTGYFIICYLVERCGMDVQAAIDEFKAARPKGVRHSHFLDQLFVRYSANGAARLGD